MKMTWPVYLVLQEKRKDFSGSIMSKLKDLKDRNLRLTPRSMTHTSSMTSLTLYLVIMYPCMELSTGELEIG